MGKVKRTVVCCYLLSILLLPNAISAEQITVTFSGVIDNHVLGLPWTEQGFNIGDAFWGQYVFESTTIGDQATNDFGGVPPERMPYPGAVLSFYATSQGNTVTSTGDIQNGILVDDNVYGRDSYFVVLSSQTSELYIDMRSTNKNLFSNPGLPTTLPDVSNFDDSAFFRVGIGGSYAQGNLNTIQIAVVPEPISSILFIVGGATLGLRRFWKKRRSA